MNQGNLQSKSHMNVECKVFYRRKCNSSQWNNDKCQCECKKPIRHRGCEEDCAWNPSTCACDCDKDFKMDEYLRLWMDKNSCWWYASCM